MRRLAILPFLLASSAAVAQTNQLPFVYGNGGTAVQVEPAVLVGYDSGTGQACIIGKTATCSLQTTGGGGGGGGGTGGGAVYGPDNAGSTPTHPGILNGYLTAAGLIANVQRTSGSALPTDVLSLPSVTVGSSALPAGASTSALQSTINTSLVSLTKVDGNGYQYVTVSNPGSGGGSAPSATDGASQAGTATVSPIAGRGTDGLTHALATNTTGQLNTNVLNTVATTVGNFPATQAVSGTVSLGGSLPAYASTPTFNIGTGGPSNYSLESGGNLAAINTNTTGLFKSGQSIGNSAFGSTNFPTTVSTGAGASSASTLRVILSTDSATGGAGSGNAAAGATGSAVPTQASYTGFNSGGNLVGVSTTSPLPSVLTAGTAAIGSITNTGFNVNNFPATQAVSNAGTFSVQNTANAFGQATTSAPTYTSGSSNPLSLNTAGSLRVDGSGSTQTVQGTVAVSGTVAENQTQIAGTAVSVNSGATDAGTQRVVLGTTQPTLNVTTTNTSYAVTQATASALNATVVGTGTLAVQNTAATPTGTNSIGTVGLNAGTNAIGSITNTTFAATQATAANLNATVVGTGTFATQVSNTVTTQGTGTAGSAVTGGVLRTGGRDGAGNVRDVLLDTTGAPLAAQATPTTAITSVAASTATAIVSATDTTRRGLEVQLETANTAPVYICYTATTTCSATVHDAMIPTSTAAGTLLIPLYTVTSTVYSFSTASFTARTTVWAPK